MLAALQCALNTEQGAEWKNGRPTKARNGGALNSVKTEQGTRGLPRRRGGGEPIQLEPLLVACPGAPPAHPAADETNDVKQPVPLGVR